MNDPQGQDSDTEKETQVTPVPSDEQKTQSVPTDQEAVEKSQEAPDEAGKLTEAKERTRHEFEKLQSKLREERERREALERVFSSMQSKPKEEPVIPVIDPNTGLPNEAALTDVQKRATSAEQRATRAEKSVQKYLNDLDNRQTYAVHPELDPNGNSFDKKLHVATRQIMLDSMLNPEDYDNKQLSFMEAATLAKGTTPKAMESARREGAKEALEKLTPKEQASLEATGSSNRRTELTSDLETLRAQSRKGGRAGTEALVERLKRLNPSG